MIVSLATEKSNPAGTNFELKFASSKEIIIRDIDPGYTWEIMGRVQKLFKKALAHENVLKMQLEINRFKKKGTFFLGN